MKKLKLKHHLLHPLLDILFPQYCAGCTQILHAGEELLCLSCFDQLPFTSLEQIPDNETDVRLYGKLAHMHAAPLLYFIEEGLVQEMMHQLKYRNRPDLGIFLGKLIAHRYLQTEWFKSIDIIVPVPLHRKKMYRRGYNQSASIAAGISAVSGIPVVEKAIKRSVNTASQTHMTRLERLENVSGAFLSIRPGDLAGKHVLLVDDVLTTGATLAACGNCILQLPDTKLSITTAALAIT
ncbi:DNA utilization protein GntX [compost metagenome]